MKSSKAQFSLVSLGCARTLVDSEHMVDKLQNNGFQLVPEGSTESITVLNTCSFIQAAIDETEDNIQTLLQRKKNNEISHLAVVGCYPSRFKKTQLQQKFPDVDLWLTTQESGQLQPKLTELVFNKKFSPQKKVPYTKLTPNHYAYLKISEGCNNWCTFCTIPKIRGKHQSKSIPDIIEEANKQISFGAKELLLIAEDTTAWGEDTYGTPNFPKLLDHLAETAAQWIRPMYIFPSRVNTTLIQTIKKHPSICNYIDMPIQHVSTHLLEAMNRRHDRAFLESLLDQFFTEIPDLALRTTFILGFPGETDKDVDDLISFITKYPFRHIGCFGYSEEKETRSARFDNKVPPTLIQERIKRIMTHHYALLEKRNQSRIGNTYSLLYEGHGIGRTYAEAPDVDGSIVITNPDQLIPGHFYTVKITNVDGYDLIGSVQ